MAAASDTASASREFSLRLESPPDFLATCSTTARRSFFVAPAPARSRLALVSFR
jgi:hypothetical protein